MDSLIKFDELEKKIASSSKLIETAHGLWRAQILSSAQEIGLFDYLESEESRPKNIHEIKHYL
jgi:hypothetical protein